MSKNPAETLTELSNDARDMESQLSYAREIRNQSIRDAIKNDGLTMYAVSKITGLTQPAIKKIITK